MEQLTLVKEDLVLRFEIESERYPKADSVANALLAFVDVLQTASDVVDTATELSIELINVKPGSQRFLLKLRRIEGVAQRIADSTRQFPYIMNIILSLGTLVTGTLFTQEINNYFANDTKISKEQMAVFEKMGRDLNESVELQRKAALFWGIAQNDPAFSGVEVLRSENETALYKIPRSDFANRSGLWSADQEVTPILQIRTAIWDVILIKATLVPKPRKWTFAHDGLIFPALMADKVFLQAIHDRTLPLRLAEGVSMKVEVKYKEKLEGESWIPIPGSYQIVRVISPRPSEINLSLFPATHNP